MTLPTLGGINSLGSRQLVIDTTAPTAVITYSPIGPYKQDTSVTITATFNESVDTNTLLTPQISMSAIPGGDPLSPTPMTKSLTINNTYTYTYSIPSGNGTCTISLSNGQDLAGNLITTANTIGNTLIVDNTAPTIINPFIIC